ncbi:hypothetical protein [Streptomyces sp. CA2R101]|uniref:hypothetical protein n=1 Tax=Streptomyces sp. CA2R101 TaxID=3120152 RepID=UPI0030090661
MPRFLLFLIRVQWIDRLATSSFLIGITLQTAMLTLALVRTASAPDNALVLATRAAMLTCTAIVLLSAMSNIQNEYRYGTIERVLLGKLPFSRLIAVRSTASALVASPAIVVPFIGATLTFPSLLCTQTLVLVLMVYVYLAALCYQSTLLLCQFKNSAAMVPWLRMFLLFIGLSVIPFPGSETLSLFLPTGWMLCVARSRDAGAWGLETIMFAAVIAVWTGGVWLGLRNRSLRIIERNLTDGAEAT